MCGLAGEIRFNDSRPNESTVRRMVENMRPRGPDAEGLFADGAVLLGHRRLKIIDLTDAGSQPMHDQALGLCIVFNGCIYNHRELRVELEEAGYTFFSHSDTEVILKSFHKWGKQCVERFNGMFAFAIWNQRDGSLFIARDRLGIKPFYYNRFADGLRFASTLPALLAAGNVDTSIDPVALNYYLSFHAVVPAPRTLLQGVRKLPPATRVTVSAAGDWQEETFWSVEYLADNELDFESAKVLVEKELRTAVRRRLVADVPVGVLLSGGLDSSLITGLLHEEGQDNLQTFSVGFESVNGMQGDEFKYSDIIAEHYQTAHHKIRVSSDELLPALDDCVTAMSEPMVSHDVIGFYLLSREVAKHMKVVQSGQGADEVFGGYHWYPPLLDSDSPVDDYAEVFMDRDYEEYKRTVGEDYHGGSHSENFITEYFSRSRAKRAVDKALHMDTNIMLVDDPVKRVDNMTMAWGLEARVPFLDHCLVEAAARIPAEYKVSEGGKYVLKEVARKVIPEGVIDRPKGYFPVPALKYLRGEYLGLVKKLLNARVAKNRGLFNRDYLDTLFEDPENHITPLRGSKLWQVALLEYWLQSHGIT